MAYRRLSCVAFVVLLVCTIAQAQIPRTLSYQGLLTDTVGTPLPDGIYNISFRMYQTSSGGSALWQEARALQTKRGVFSTNLGEVTPMVLPFDRQYWLSVQINGDPELVPRMVMNASAYSLRAQKADTASYALTAPLQAATDSARIAGTIPNNSVGTAKLQDSSVTTSKISSTGALSGQAIMYNGATVGWGSPGAGGQWTTTGSHIYNNNSGNVGIGTTSLSGTSKLSVSNAGTNSSPLIAVRGEANNTSGDAHGGYFLSNAFNGAGYGVYASGNTYGVYGTGFYGLYGTSTSGTGVYGTSSSGNGVYGSGGNAGVAGYSSLVGVDGQGGNYGVTGASLSGTGVSGTSTNGYGVYASSTNGYGIYAVGGPNGVVASASSGAGVSATSTNGPGVVASGGTNGVEATGGTRGVYAGGGTYGVVGFATGSVDPHIGIYGAEGGTISTAWAGWFAGRVYMSGFLEVDGFIFKDGGGFKIDHPTDPANKYLYHSFVESPDMKNIYDGVVTVDTKGEAIVTLPDWFGAVNRDFRYQLTAVGGPGPNLYIAEEITGNHFKIAGGATGMKVSWQVTGIRKDAYAEAHRIPVEEEKPAKERGKYRNPKELGMSETLGIHYEETQRMAAERERISDQQSKMVAEQQRQEENRTKMGRGAILPEKQK